MKMKKNSLIYYYKFLIYFQIIFNHDYNCSRPYFRAKSHRQADTNKKVQYWHLIPALNAWVGRARPITNRFPGHGCDHRSLTSQMNVALFDSQLRVSLMCLAYFLTSYSSCTGRRPGDWWKKYMFALYVSDNREMQRGTIEKSH